MNSFAYIELVLDRKTVKYYSLRLEDDNDPDRPSEYDRFLEHMEPKVIADSKLAQRFGELMAFIDDIGNDRAGALGRHFRNEAKRGEGLGLPPKRMPGMLRLYCHRLNERVVFLFNGDVKTTHYPEDCPSVRSHFLDANRFSRSIDRRFRDGDIWWNDDYTNIGFSNPIALEP